MSELCAHTHERVGCLLLDHLGDPVVAASTACSRIACVADTFDAASAATNDVADFAIAYAGTDANKHVALPFR